MDPKERQRLDEPNASRSLFVPSNRYDLRPLPSMEKFFASLTGWKTSTNSGATSTTAVLSCVAFDLLALNGVDWRSRPL